MYIYIGKKPGKLVFFGKITKMAGGKTGSSTDFTIKNVPLQTILCGFVKVRLNNF
jgi:hypothetical protein